MERIKEARKEPPGWQRPPGLTDERRVELQNIIVDRRESQPVREEYDDDDCKTYEIIEMRKKNNVDHDRSV